MIEIDDISRKIKKAIKRKWVSVVIGVLLCTRLLERR